MPADKVPPAVWCRTNGDRRTSKGKGLKTAFGGRMRTKILAAVLVLVAMAGPGTASGAEEPTLSASQRAWIASRIYAAVQTYFGHWRGAPGLDFDEEYRTYLNEILTSSDRQ